MVDVRSEPRTYGPAHPENSYFQDLALRAAPEHPDHQQATDRLNRHALEVVADAQAKEGEYARRGLRGALGRERRAMSSGTTSGGSFVSPEWLTGDWAAFRTADKSFTNSTTNLPLPEYGLTVNIPSFTSAAGGGQQTSENMGVSESDPSGTAIAAPLATIAGQVTISQQLSDRGGMSGLTFDSIIGQQIQEQLFAQEDIYVINQALTNAGTVTDASFTIANFYADIAKARELLTDTSGVRLNPTHVFSTSDLFGFITRQVDDQHRPIVTPDSSALVAAASDPEWAAWTGIHLPGALRWFSDDNIPASGSNTQIIVARPEEVFTFDGDYYAFSFPETQATTLSVTVGVRSYVGVVVRFPKAIAVISGNAYPTSDV